LFKISKIHFLSKEALEAEVTLTDGENQLICFSQPLNYNLNDNIETSLYSYGVSNIVKEQDKEFYIKKQHEPFAYELKGELIDKDNCLVKIGSIIIEIEKSVLPKDFETGDFISFNCRRVDLY